MEENNEQYVTLVRQRHLRIVAEHLLSMLEAAPGKRIPLNDLADMYMKQQGYPIHLQDFQVTSMKELMSKLPRLVRIESVSVTDDSDAKTESPVDEDEENEVIVPAMSVTTSKTELEEISLDSSETRPISSASSVETVKNCPLQQDSTEEASQKSSFVEYVCLADRTQIKHLAHKVLLILLDSQSGSLTINAFTERFRCTFRDEPNLHLIYKELADIVEVSG